MILLSWAFPRRRFFALRFVVTGAAAMFSLRMGATGETFEREFSFQRATAKAENLVDPSQKYSDLKTFGFEEINRSTLQQSELGVGNAKPFRFSIAVPEGNYAVAITGAGHASSEQIPLTIRSESRRLMVESWSPESSGETRTFNVNVRNASLPPPPQNAPGRSQVSLNEREINSFTWDNKLTLEFSGSSVFVSKILVRAISCPTIFLAGDSTVTDQPTEPAASWGQMLPRFMTATVAVANHAESGETLKSFLYEMRLSKVLSQLAPGDYVFIEFGHNDEKKQWPVNYVDANTTYKAYLRTYIAEVRLRGATPVLVTPIQRRTFDEHGKIKNTHGEYPDAVRQVAAEESITLVDLDRASTTFYEALGPEDAPRAFNNGGKDATHHNNYGAYELAKCVAQQISASPLPLAAAVTADAKGFNPSHPDDVNRFALPASADRSQAAIRGN